LGVGCIGAWPQDGGEVAAGSEPQGHRQSVVRIAFVSHICDGIWRLSIKPRLVMSTASPEACSLILFCGPPSPRQIEFSFVLEDGKIVSLDVL
jgi:hypothetical protein